MKNAFLLFIISLLLCSCYSIPEIEGFDQEKWRSDIENCEDHKLTLANLLINNAEKIYGEGEAEVKQLLGQPAEHELYRRNQKFFYYNLTRLDCPEPKRLSIRFDALDRVKEILIIEWEDKN